MSTTSVRERPIIFGAPMIRAILAGTKTATRRVVKLIAGVENGGGLQLVGETPDGFVWRDRISSTIPIRCPYGKPGDRLLVRETWALVRLSFDSEMGCVDDVEEWAGPLPKSLPRGWVVWYAADSDDTTNHPDDRFVKRWRPSIHMPRWASRIMLEITGVRVQKLNEISEEDAHAEGVDPLPGTYTADFAYHGYVPAFAQLWDQINGKRGFSWGSNCWVWCLTFKRINPEGDTP